MINKAKTKEIWKGIKQLICLKSNSSISPRELIINEHEITNGKKILGINYIKTKSTIQSLFR